MIPDKQSAWGDSIRKHPGLGGRAPGGGLGGRALLTKPTISQKLKIVKISANSVSEHYASSGIKKMGGGLHVVK